jgi:hypothetical protein
VLVRSSGQIIVLISEGVIVGGSWMSSCAVSESLLLPLGGLGLIFGGSSLGWLVFLSAAGFLWCIFQVERVFVGCFVVATAEGGWSGFVR